MQNEGGLSMKIITQCTKEEQPKRVDCKKCGSTLEIVASDVKSEDADCGGMMEGQKMTVWHYTCPCCHKRNYLKYADLPKGHPDKTDFD